LSGGMSRLRCNRLGTAEHRLRLQLVPRGDKACNRQKKTLRGMATCSCVFVGLSGRFMAKAAKRGEQNEAGGVRRAISATRNIDDVWRKLDDGSASTFEEISKVDTSPTLGSIDHPVRNASTSTLDRKCPDSPRCRSRCRTFDRSIRAPYSDSSTFHRPQVQPSPDIFL